MLYTINCVLLGAAITAGVGFRVHERELEDLTTSYKHQVEQAVEDGVSNCNIEQEEVAADYENQIAELKKQIAALKHKGK